MILELHFPKEVILFKPAFQNNLIRNSMSFRREVLQRNYEHAQLYLQDSSFPSVVKELSSTQPLKFPIFQYTFDQSSQQQLPSYHNHITSSITQYQMLSRSLYLHLPSVRRINPCHISTTHFIQLGHITDITETPLKFRMFAKHLHPLTQALTKS